MRKKIKNIAVRISGFGSNNNNKANGGEGLTDCEFLSVGLDFSLAIDSRSKIMGWGENISGVLNFGANGLSNLNFESVSAGYNHAVGIFSFPSLSSSPFVYNLNYQSPNSAYNFSSSYTGNWNSPFWNPKTISDPFSGFAKNVSITGIFDAGVVIKRHPDNFIIYDEKYLTAGAFSGNFDLSENQSFSLEVFPRTRFLLPGVNNPWSANSKINIFKKSNVTNMVTGWGSNLTGQLDFLQHLSNINARQPTYALAGNNNTLILFKDGTVTGCGYNLSGQISSLESLNSIVDFSAGSNHCLFLNKNGTIASRGSNSHGQRNLGHLSSVSLIAAGGNRSIALYKNPQDPSSYKVFATGEANADDLNSINFIENAIYANASVDGFIIILKDGSVLGFGSERCSGLLESFSSIKNAIYGFDGYNFSQFIINAGIKNMNFLEINAGLNFLGNSDQVIETLNVDTAINKKVETVSDIKYLKKQSSNFSVNFYTGIYPTVVSDSFLKISGASLKDNSVTGRNFIYKYLEDPVLEVYNRGELFSVDDWVTSPAFSDLSYKNETISSGYINPLSFSGKDPFIRIKRKQSDTLRSNYFFKVDEKNAANNSFLNLDNEPNRFVFSWNNLPSENNKSVDLISVNNAFLTYDNRTGTNSKNVFAYALEFDQAVFSTFSVFQSDTYKNYFYLPILKTPPMIFSGWHSFLERFAAMCVSIEGCDNIESKDKEMCVDGLTGQYSFPAGGTGKTALPPTGRDYQRWLSGIEKEFRKLENTGDPSKFNNNLYEVGIGTGAFDTSFVFSGSSGIILFGDFFSGDRLTFKPYNMDPLGYSGLYRSLYLEDPPYRELPSFSLEFKKDFNDPSGLFSALKNNFSAYTTNPQKTGYIWYWGMGCRTGFGETGVYEKVELPLADVFYIDPYDFFSGISEETRKYWTGRIIGYKSNYFHQSGYSMILEKNTRRIDLDVDQIDGLKFILPNKISVYGSEDGNSWRRLDFRTNIDWTGLEPTIRPVEIGYFDEDSVISAELGNLSGYNEDSVSDDIFAKTGFQIQTGDFSFSGVPTDPHYVARQLFEMKRSYYKQEKPFCEPVLLEEYLTAFYAGSGVSCKPPKESGESGKKDPPGTSLSTGKAPLLMSSIRTGWLIDYDKLGVSQNEIIDLKLNYLKVEFDDFMSPVNFYGMKPLSWFHVKNINFFSVVKELPMAETGINCWVNGDYEITPSGYIPVNISGTFTADVRLSDSGIRKFSSAALSGRIVGLSSGDYVRFNRLSGRLVSDSGSGIYNGELVATGRFCTGVVDWYYNKDTKIVDTVRSFCSDFSGGSGFFSGSYLRIKPEIVNRDLALGKFLNPAVEVNFETGVIYSGYFYHNNFVSGYTGYLKIPYNITGFSTSGFINFNKQFDGSSNGSIIRVTGDPSGYNIASGWLKINEGLLVENDFIILNGNDIFYNTNSANAGPPDYFKDFASLCDIFTGDLYSSLFNCSFEIDDLNKSIFIKALPLGDSGNTVTFSFGSVSGGISGIDGVRSSGSYLSGGKTFYQYISGTGNYSYSLGLSGYPVTGFYYSNSGSGFIFGPVSTYQGERDFTGVWSLATGLSAFIENLILVSGSGSLFSGRYNQEGLGTYPERLNIAVNYEDEFGLGGKDVGVLSVFDRNYKYIDQYNNLITGSGVSIIIENY